MGAYDFARDLHIHAHRQRWLTHTLGLHYIALLIYAILVDEQTGSEVAVFHLRDSFFGFLRVLRRSGFILR